MYHHIIATSNEFNNAILRIDWTRAHVLSHDPQIYPREHRFLLATLKAPVSGIQSSPPQPQILNGARNRDPMEVAPLIIFLFLLYTPLLVHAKTEWADIEALRLLRDEVKDRDPFWAGLVANWQYGGPNGEDDPCGMSWKGLWEGVECRDQEHLPYHTPRKVTNLHLTDRALSGPIPLGVGLLKNLIEIDMDGNRLTGPLNPYIGCLHNLVEFDLANNTITGTIPSEWRFLTKLVEGEFHNNKGLNGCIPKGMPAVTTDCHYDLNSPIVRKYGKPVCELVGTLTMETGVSGFCSDWASTGKKCATPNFVRKFIEEGMDYEKHFKSES